MSITLKLIAPGDEALLAKIAADVFDEPVEPAQLATYLAQPNHRMILALAGDEVVGKCTGVIHHRPDKRPELYIDEVDVSPLWRRQGIARAMFDEMMTVGKSLGCSEAWVGTEADNVAAERLYQSGGAEAVAVAMYEYEL